ncbi:hypothetical protein RUND412_000699 [Rhizina undulata]
MSSPRNLLSPSFINLPPTTRSQDSPPSPVSSGVLLLFSPFPDPHPPYRSVSPKPTAGENNNLTRFHPASSANTFEFGPLCKGVSIRQRRGFRDQAKVLREKVERESGPGKVFSGRIGGFEVDGGREGGAEEGGEVAVVREWRGGGKPVEGREGEGGEGEILVGEGL